MNQLNCYITVVCNVINHVYIYVYIYIYHISKPLALFSLLIIQNQHLQDFNNPRTKKRILSSISSQTSHHHASSLKRCNMSADALRVKRLLRFAQGGWTTTENTPQMAVSENRVFSFFFPPYIIHFNRVFHDFHHSFWGTTIFGNTQMVV